MLKLISGIVALFNFIGGFFHDRQLRKAGVNRTLIKLYQEEIRKRKKAQAIRDRLSNSDLDDTLDGL